MKSTRLGVWLLLGVSLLAACGGEPRPDVEPMEFSVDPSRLGAPVEAIDLGIVFRPPAGWMPLLATDLDSIGRAIAGNALDLRPHYVFAHPSNGSLLNVATVGQADSLTLGEQVARYRDVLAAQDAGATVQQAEYLKDGIHVAQFLVQAKGYVTFTLFFASSRDGVLQFDYIVPRASYPEQAKAIESSIGSIQVLD